MVHKTAAALAGALLLFGGCSQTPAEGSGEPGETVLLHIALPGAATRAPGTKEGGTDDPDSRVSRLRVLGYRKSGERLAFNQYIDPLEENPETIEVPTGTYHFVFIANEHTDPALHARLKALEVGSSRYATLPAESFALGAFGSDEVPMTALYRDVTVTGDNEVTGTGVSCNPDGDWQVVLTRLGVKVSLTLALTGPQYDAFTAGEGGTLSFANLPHRVHLPEGTANDDDGQEANRQTVPHAELSKDAAKKEITLERYILPESFFRDAENAGKAVRLVMTYPGTDPVERSAPLGSGLMGTPKDYTLVRNTHLNVAAQVAETEFVITAELSDWENKEMGEHDLF